MSIDLEPFPLTLLPSRLSEMGVPVSYAESYRCVLDAAIKSHRKGRLLMINPADLPEIAAFFRAKAACKTDRIGRTKPMHMARPAAYPEAIPAK